MPLEFTEYGYAGAVQGELPALPGDDYATQEVAIGAGSEVSAAFGSATRLIVITSISADCRIAVGPGTPVAANVAPKSRLLIAGSEYVFAVGQGQKLAVIQAAP